MEPYLDPAATAALYSPDAGTLIPYEYTIALAENAADNGVEVRVRRAVESIQRADDGLFDIQVNHWEPADYAEGATARENPLKRMASALRLKKRKSGDAEKSLGNYYGGHNEAGPWEKFPELVKGKQSVSVDDMKVGGSGSRRAMGGVSVGTETIRAKYVVNCAGGASDKIARMVGDDSFKIKPRLGEYVLLKKSQGKVCNHILFPCPGKYGKGILVQKTLWGNVILGPTARDVHEWKDPNADPTFNPKRAANIVPKDGDTGLAGIDLVYTPDDKTEVNALNVAPEANVVCKCEKVTEAEVVEAC